MPDASYSDHLRWLLEHLFRLVSVAEAFLLTVGEEIQNPNPGSDTEKKDRINEPTYLL